MEIKSTKKFSTTSDSSVNWYQCGYVVVLVRKKRVFEEINTKTQFNLVE